MASSDNKTTRASRHKWPPEWHWQDARANELRVGGASTSLASCWPVVARAVTTLACWPSSHTDSLWGAIWLFLSFSLSLPLARQPSSSAACLPSKARWQSTSSISRKRIGWPRTERRQLTPIKVAPKQWGPKWASKTAAKWQSNICTLCTHNQLLANQDKCSAQHLQAHSLILRQMQLAPRPPSDNH